MKKKGGIFILVLALVLVVFAFFTSNIGATYWENYGYNLRVNLKGLIEKLGISTNESFREFLDEAEPSQPQTELDRLKQEYAEIEKENEKIEREKERLEQEKQEAANKESEKANEEYNSTTVKHTGKNIAMENASAARYERYSGGIICASETQLSFYSSKGTKRWSSGIQISSPVMRVAGNYILLFEKNGKKFTLYNGEKEIYTNSIEGTVKTAAVSEKGDAVIVFDRENYKGSVAVFNKAGEEVYLWNSGTHSIIDADISNSRRLAVALLDSTGLISSKLYFFDIEKSDVDAMAEVKDTLVFDVVFDGDTLNAFADNKTLGIASNGKIKWTYDAEKKNITKYAMTDGGTKAMVFDNENASEVTLLSGSGAEKNVIKSEVLPDFIDIAGGRLLYNNGRTIMINNLSGKLLSQYICSRDVKEAYLIDSGNIFIVYASSIEFLSLKGE